MLFRGLLVTVTINKPIKLAKSFELDRTSFCKMFTVTAIQIINYLPDDVIKYTVAALHIINPVTNVDSIQASLVT